LPRRQHPPLGDQLLDALDVHAAPDAPRLARGEADGPALRVAVLAEAVDPPGAERLVQDILVAGPSLPRPDLPEADQQLGLPGMVLLEPPLRLGRVFEEVRGHCRPPT